MSVEPKLSPCRWCGKHNRTASEWEQFSTYRDHGWMRLCVRCANRRLNNPWNALMPLRRVGGVDHPGACPKDCQICTEARERAPKGTTDA